MLRGVGIHRLVLPAVNRQVGLPVAVEIQPACHNSASNRLLEDASADALAFPADFTRQADIHRDDVHHISTWRAPARRRSDAYVWRCTPGNPRPRSGPNPADAAPPPAHPAGTPRRLRG